MSSTFQLLSQQFSKEELLQLTPEQILAFASTLSLETKPALKTSISVHATQLPDDKQLKGVANWIEFKRSFPNMLRELNLWCSPASKEKKGHPGSPDPSVGIYILEKNIKHSSSLTRIATCANAAEGWAILLKEFDKQTIPAKMSALSAVLKHSPNPKSNIRTGFDTHTLNRTAMLTAFGETIKTEALADLLFVYLLTGYQFQTDTFKNQANLDFDAFQAAVEIEFDSRIKPNPSVSPSPVGNALGTPKAALAKNGKECPTHGSQWYFDHVCRRCEPCKKCASSGSQYTWHKQDSPSCKTNPSANLSHANPNPQHPDFAFTQYLHSQYAAFQASQKPTPANSPTSGLTKPTVLTMVADSGNTHPIIRNKEAFNLYYPAQYEQVGLAGEGSSMPIDGAGTLHIDTYQGSAVMHDVLHCPDATDNLLSISRLDDYGMGSVFCDGFFVFPKHLVSSFVRDNLTKAVFQGYRDGALYKLDLSLTPPQDSPQSFMSVLPKRTMQEWHLATNHLHSRALKRMPQMVDGMVLGDRKECDCIACIVGKAKKDPHPRSKHVVNRLGERISGDWIEGLTPGLNGETGSLHLIDSCSKKSFVYQFCHKDEIQAKVLHFCAYIETHTGRPIGLLLLDQGSNFTCNELSKYCLEKGIDLQFSPVDTPSQNSNPERLHYTLMDDVRCILAQTGLPQFLWPYMIDHACYTRNLCPVSGRDKVPDHVWFDRKPNVAHLRPFGVPCYPRIPDKDQTSKLDSRATSAIFAGYDTKVKAFRCLDSSNYGLIVAPHVQFLKDYGWPKLDRSRFSEKFLLDAAALPDTDSEYFPTQDEIYDDEEIDDLLCTSVELDATQRAPQDFQGDEDHDLESSDSLSDEEPSAILSSRGFGNYTLESSNVELAPRDINAPPAASKRISRPPPSTFFANARRSGHSFHDSHFPSAYHSSLQPSAFVSQLLPPPNHYKNISGRPDAAAWYEAADKEISGLRSRGFIRSLIPRSEVPKVDLIYKSRYVFTRKASGLAKARWCIRGDMRKRHEKRFPETIDHSFTTYAPVAENATFKTLCAIVAHEDLEFEQVDVDQAFTCANHPGTVYVEQPEGYTVPGKEDHVIVLGVAVYGLPESPILWNEEIDQYLVSEGFVSSDADPCLYMKEFESGKMYILVYVDDLAIAHSSLETIKVFKNRLHAKYGIKDLGPLRKFTSYQIERDRLEHTITIHQHDYISELISSAQMPLCAPLSAPPTTLNHLSKTMSPQSDIERADMAGIPYRETVGALLHIANRTRPDLAHAVSVLSRFNSNPGKQHWNAVKQLLRYLKGTSRIGLVLGGKDPLKLIAYVDANFAQDPDSRRSTSGFVFLFGKAAVSFKSRLQKAVTTSSCEAEIAALFGAASESVWLRRLLSFFGYLPDGPTTIFEDNQGAIKFSHSRESYGRMKHIDIKHRFIREQIRAGVISISFVSSSQNPADILTKSLNPKLAISHRQHIGLHDYQNAGAY